MITGVYAMYWEVDPFWRGEGWQCQVYKTQPWNYINLAPILRHQLSGYPTPEQKASTVEVLRFEVSGWEPPGSSSIFTPYQHSTVIYDMFRHNKELGCLGGSRSVPSILQMTACRAFRKSVRFSWLQCIGFSEACAWGGQQYGAYIGFWRPPWL